MVNNVDKLAIILADMLRSALAWEQEHGTSLQNSHKIEPLKPLTIIDVTDTLNASNTSQNTDRGENSYH